MKEHSPDVLALVRPQVSNLPSYDAGAQVEQIKTQYGLPSVIKLSNNENPLGISPKISEFLSSKVELLGHYPDPVSRNLQHKLAEHLNVDYEKIIIGNGSENILELLCQAFINNDDRVLTQSPCFSLHEIFPLMMGAKVKKISHDKSFSINIDSWLEALKQPTKMLFISNPSNPVGNIFNHQQLLTVINATEQDALIVIDEAYYEYAINDDKYPDALELLRAQKRPWIVLRTFSKAYALAGLRVGYAIASDRAIIDALHRVRTPYNVNFLAQEAAILALDDREYLTKSTEHIVLEKAKMSQILKDAGFVIPDSYANFIFIDTTKNALNVAEKLMEQGIIVKAWCESGYETFIRVSIGLAEENEKFVRTFINLMSTKAII